MKILLLTDIHGDTSKLKKIKEDLFNADLILLSGDITHFGHKSEIDKVIKKIAKYNNHILAVSGNCDYAEVDDYLHQLGINLDGKIHKSNSLTFIGLNGSLPCPGKTPNELTEQEYQHKLNSYNGVSELGDKLVLISHQPPKNTKNDKVSDVMHVGSESIRSFIEEKQPLLCLCGHIHEGIGIDNIGETKIINPGPFMHKKYAIININEKNEVDVQLKNVT